MVSGPKDKTITPAQQDELVTTMMESYDRDLKTARIIVLPLAQDLLAQKFLALGPYSPDSAIRAKIDDSGERTALKREVAEEVSKEGSKVRLNVNVDVHYDPQLFRFDDSTHGPTSELAADGIKDGHLTYFVDLGKGDAMTSLVVRLGKDLARMEHYVPLEDDTSLQAASLDYEKAWENVEPKMREALEEVRSSLIRLGVKNVSEVEEAKGDEYELWFSIPDGNGKPAVTAVFTLLDAKEYGENGLSVRCQFSAKERGPKDTTGFSWGELGAYAPHNYTDVSWTNDLEELMERAGGLPRTQAVNTMLDGLVAAGIPYVSNG